MCKSCFQSTLNPLPELSVAPPPAHLLWPDLRPYCNIRLRPADAQTALNTQEQRWAAPQTASDGFQDFEAHWRTLNRCEVTLRAPAWGWKCLTTSDRSSSRRTQRQRQWEKAEASPGVTPWWGSRGRVRRGCAASPGWEQTACTGRGRGRCVWCPAGAEEGHFSPGGDSGNHGNGGEVMSCSYIKHKLWRAFVLMCNFTL